MLQRSYGHRGGCQGQNHGNIPDISPVGNGDPPCRNQGPNEKYNSHDGHKAINYTHQLRNFVLVHLIEVLAFLFIKFVVNHSDSDRNK